MDAELMTRWKRVDDLVRELHELSVKVEAVASEALSQAIVIHDEVDDIERAVSPAESVHDLSKLTRCELHPVSGLRQSENNDGDWVLFDDVQALLSSTAKPLQQEGGKDDSDRINAGPEGEGYIKGWKDCSDHHALRSNGGDYYDIEQAFEDAAAARGMRVIDYKNLVRLKQAAPPAAPQPSNNLQQASTAQAEPAKEPLTLENAPLGTKAPAFNGGHWERVEHGWKWCTGSTFPRPGGDWNGNLIAPEVAGATDAGKDEQNRREAENAAFFNWWKDSGHADDPTYTLTMENCAHSVWQARAELAAEDEWLADRLGKLLAGVAVALKGPEPARKRWSYHDLPEIAAKAVLEIELHRTKEASQATPEGDNSRIIAEGLEAAHTLINMIPTRLENHDTEAIARIGEFVNEKGGFNAINSARNAWLSASQPRIINKDNAAAFLEEKLWEFIETAGNFPSVKPDDRIWGHVLAYMPKHVPIPAFALEDCAAPPSR